MNKTEKEPKGEAGGKIKISRSRTRRRRGRKGRLGEEKEEEK